MLSFFANLKLAERLGVAFGALVAALLVTAVLSINGLGAIQSDDDWIRMVVISPRRRAYGRRPPVT